MNQNLIVFVVLVIVGGVLLIAFQDKIFPKQGNTTSGGNSQSNASNESIPKAPAALDIIKYFDFDRRINPDVITLQVAINDAIKYGNKKLTDTLAQEFRKVNYGIGSLIMASKQMTKAQARQLAEEIEA